jgi:thymidylate synthase ThyX
LNLRALRHTIMMRTARFAEWEIRYVFAEVYKLLKSRFPTIFHGAKEKEYNGILEITGMRTQPYELTSSVVLSELSDEQLEMELVRRRGQSSITT